MSDIEQKIQIKRRTPAQKIAPPSLPPKAKKSHKARWIVISSVGVLFLAIVGFYGWRLLTLKDFASQSKAQIIAQLAEAKLALESLNPDGASKPLADISSELAALQTEAGKYGVLRLATWWGKIQEKFKALPGVLQDLTGISGTAIHVNEDLAYLKQHTLGMLLGGKGAELLDRLAQLQDKLARLDGYVVNIKSQPGLDEHTLQTLGEFNEELNQATQALASMRTFLNPEKDRHVFVMFQNETELRPGGGFLGSYADVTIAHGEVANIEVRDIYDPDGQLFIKVIPPKPLQRLTKDWGARDANWFFDFPTSAKKVLSFMNQSRIYTDRNVTFEGALALNTRVIGDIIDMVGPIELPDFKLNITGDTFMRELQREVEAGENKKINQPKKVLQTLAPILIDRLKNRNAIQDDKLLAKVRDNFARKDIMLYLDDPTLEQQLVSRNVGGEVAQLPKTNVATISDYLAVVSANLAGGKSDFLTRQDIKLVSTFSATGTLVNELTLTRHNNGEHETDWWYKSPNKTYTQFYIPIGSKLYSAKGNREWPTPIKRVYSADYETDPDVSAIEDTHRFFDDEQLDRFIAFGKTAFAGWITTPVGATSTFSFIYRNPKKFTSAVTQYEFMFEKQSGANTSFDFSLTAPEGYIWKESNGATLEYRNDDPPGRVKVTGTLVKLQ